MSKEEFNCISKFTTQAIESLISLKKVAQRMFPSSLDSIDETVSLLRKANKFSLPDDGVLVDLKDYRDEYQKFLRLPYPCVTLEFRVTPKVVPGRITSSKAIIFCWSDGCDTSFNVKGVAKDTIYFSRCWFDDETQEWDPSPIVWSFRPSELEIEGGEIMVSGFQYFPSHPDIYEDQKSRDGDGFIQEEIDQFFRPVLEFCLTVNCKNVSTRIISPPEKPNRKRHKNNKEPLYSYHVLDIPVSEESDGGSGSLRSGPRLHLRRGHLRRLASGSIIWVRHAIVGSSDLGRVDKSYNVHPNIK